MIGGDVMTQEQVMRALRQVVDPEVGINVVDLGLVYDVTVEGADVRVAMTMTTRACPLHDMIVREAESAIRAALPGARSVQVSLVWEPPWNPAMMSEAAKRQLGWFES
jgi:metal-sulfur cluster biosynthetic enzyme